MEKYLAVNLALLKFILKNIVDTLLEQNKYFVLLWQYIFNIVKINYDIYRKLYHIKIKN